MVYVSKSSYSQRQLERSLQISRKSQKWIKDYKRARAIITDSWALKTPVMTDRLLHPRSGAGTAIRRLLSTTHFFDYKLNLVFS